ncbi:cell division cycle protein 23 homolog isoform X2 [Muntiacus reevesi]|uniref:cell division cycle protein 23 homolog isoform X2 n=1 Tax=Muntiacus reevesi TaxID=9886 RepID=UPI003307A888
MIGWGGRDRKMAASSSIVSVAATASSAPVLPASCNFSNLREIKKQLLLIAGLTRERGLLHSSKWSAELAFSLPALPLSELQPPPPITEEDAQDMDAYTLAKAYFDVKEYDRAAHFLHGCNSKKAYFLYMYSRYLSGEKKKDDETVDSLGPLEKGQVKNEALRELRVELSKKHQARELDGFGLYLYGVVLRKLDLVKEAIDVFVEATHVLPLHWGAWLELCNLITDKEMSMKSELSYLAHNLCEIDKYRVETCCVIGNYYSLRSQHEKAALYFQRALKLNPRYLGAWTLMGHEYMEMKNTSAAIQAYRHAIEVNKRDYRAWYGLGQTYEILKMPFYCLYYYRRAHQLRPNDSRMLVALGECYEKLNQLVEAKKCYWRAYAVGDVEKMALVKLAKLHEQLTESEQAAQCYIKYIQDIYSCGEIVEHLEESTAFRYLAQYYFKCKLWDEASACAQKCCAFNDTREEGKALLRQILQLRNQGETPSTEIPAPFFLPASLSANNTPTRRVSPLNLSSVTP